MMDSRGISARIHDLPALARRGLIGALILLSLGIGWSSLAARSPDVPVALWWPAIGVLFAAVLASRGRRLGVAAVIIVAVTISNLLGGQPPALALAYGFANALEVWIIVRVLTRGGAHAAFTSMKNVGWFLISVGVGTSVFAIFAATAAAVLTGADFLLATSSLATSHGSALFAIAPLALVSLAPPLRFSRWELSIQTLVLAGLTLVVFAPAEALALTFLIITVLIWGAHRLPPLVVVLQTLALAVVATVTTANGIGPFAALLATDLRGAIFALQLFVMSHAAMVLLVSAQRADWQKNVDALAQRESEASAVADNLRLLNAQKDGFIAAVSHELRTPVTSVLGFSEQLIETPLDEESAQASRIIHRNARRLADVIEDVLELSRLSTAEGNLRLPVELDARAVLTGCVEEVIGASLGDRDLRIDLRVPEEPVLVVGVEQDMSRVCSNLLSNAMKFSPPGGRIAVTMEVDSDAFEVRIEDEGPGIPLEEQDAVWDRFYRVQSPRHRDVPGTGLGLAIVRTLVEERIGGSIELLSDGVRGTTAIVRVPRHSRIDAPESHRAGS